MKHRWLEESETCEELAQRLGVKVREIAKGQIVVGYQDSRDAEGNPVRVPITRRGIELDLEGETPETLHRLDMIMPGLKREGAGIDVDRETADAINQTMHLTTPLEEQIGVLRAQIVAILNTFGLPATAEFARFNEVAIKAIEAARVKKVV